MEIIKINRGIESLESVIKRKFSKPSTSQPIKKKKRIYPWMLVAFEILKEIPDAKTKRSSVFQLCKRGSKIAKICLLDCQELGKMSIKYWLKLIKIYGKQIPQQKNTD